MPGVLFVAEEEGIEELTSFFEVLEEKGVYHIERGSRHVAADFLEQGHFELLIVDCSHNERDGLLLLDNLTKQYPEIRGIMLTKHASFENSVHKIHSENFEYIDKSSHPKEMLKVVDKAFERSLAKKKKKTEKTHADTGKFGNLIGESSEIKGVFSVIEKVANTDSTVLITGESGTGKELIARAIHENSNRRNNPMIVINCGAIPGELLESELFGHEKGAFTGAHRTRIGRFEMANGSTIFLDEIGDMSPNLQVKLLRVLQEQSFERVGSTKLIKVNIRVLAATNKDLASSIEEGNFREDLYYRLNVIPIKVAPLKKRKHDIPILVNYFQKKLAEYRNQGKKIFSDQAMELLINYSWPGNIRELENLMERLYVLIDQDVIQPSDLPESIRKCEEKTEKDSIETVDIYNPLDNGVGFNEAVDKFQRDIIIQALNQTSWVKAKAAELLKMNRTTLVEKIKKMKIGPENTIDF